MASIYQTFLQSPTTSVLASDASIHYITTTTSISEPTAILKHLASQAKQVIKKQEEVIHTVEGDKSICLETSTTFKFANGGGVYLPSMDSNLLDEREVTLPITHIVTFNDQNQIHQIRQYWDQGTLLKQVEAIGKSGRNWPIRDGKAQISAVKSSIKLAGTASNGSACVAAPAPAPSKTNDIPIRERSNRDSVSVTRDPHASLNLFAERDPNEQSTRSYIGPDHATRASARPAPRDYSELFVNEDTPPPRKGAEVRSLSPHKSDGTILKAGAGKHFKDVRLFSEDGEDESPRSPERKKVFNQKFDHFAFGNGEDAPKNTRPASGNSRNAQTFSFEDFATPPKVQEKSRPDYQRHWGAGVDAEDPGSPPKRPVVHAARPDAEPHFQLTDDSPAPTSKTFSRQKGAGVQPETNENDVPKKTNPVVNNARRGGDFQASYALSDDSPVDAAKSRAAGIPRSGLEAQWGFETPAKKIYKTAGDGMGGRKGPREDILSETDKKIYRTAGDGMGGRTGARDWGVGFEAPEEPQEKARGSGRGRRAQLEAQNAAELEF